jgi:hypothetical protein
MACEDAKGSVLFDRYGLLMKNFLLGLFISLNIPLSLFGWNA